MTVREYRDDDKAALIDCIVALQEFERSLDARMRPGAEIAEASLADLLKRCAKEDGRLFVAEVEGAVAGYTAVFPHVPNDDEPDEEDYHYAYISDISVLDQFRRRGLGRALMDAAEAYAREKGATLIRIGVLASNEGARTLYESQGFRDREVLLEKPLEG